MVTNRRNEFNLVYVVLLLALIHVGKASIIQVCLGQSAISLCALSGSLEDSFKVKEITFVKIKDTGAEPVASWFKDKHSDVLPAYKGKWEAVWEKYGLYLKLLNVTSSDLGPYMCDFHNGRRSREYVIFILGDDCEFRKRTENDLEKLQNELKRIDEAYVDRLWNQVERLRKKYTGLQFSVDVDIVFGIIIAFIIPALVGSVFLIMRRLKRNSEKPEKEKKDALLQPESKANNS